MKNLENKTQFLSKRKYDYLEINCVEIVALNMNSRIKSHCEDREKLKSANTYVYLNIQYIASQRSWHRNRH
jgi:hypothetical protein